MIRFRPFASVLLAAAVLAGCNANQRPQTRYQDPSAAPSASSARAAESAATAKSAAKDASEATAESERQAARTAPKPAPPIPMDLPKAETLIGQGPEELRDLLGEPSFRRRDKPAEIWQFRGDACVLDLFLYPAAAKGPRRVVHYDARDPEQGADTDAGDCFHALLRARAAAQASSS